jgi:energy-coupling factor transport system permease protein
MRSALAHFPGRSPLHRANPGPAMAYLGAIAGVAFVFSSPLILLATGVAAACAGVWAGAGRAVRAALLLAVPLLIVMTAVNALVNHRGETVLVRGWELPVLGQMDVTLESVVEGGTLGLRIAVVVVAFAVYSACVDPDRVLRLLRPVAKRSALTAALVTRMVPLAAADAGRLREASALRGPGAAEVGRTALARRLVEGSLDRAVDVAATLELRGHSLPGRPARRRERSRDDGPLWVAALLIALAAGAGLALGAGEFDTFPALSLSLDVPTLVLAGLLPLLAAVPFGWRLLRDRGLRPRGPATGAGVARA